MATNSKISLPILKLYSQFENVTHNSKSKTQSPRALFAAGGARGSMVGGMVQNSTNQNHHQHQQPTCSSTFFFYINNKIRPTSTINIIINHRNMPNSTTRENQHQQKFLFSSTTICLTTNIGHRLQQQNTFNNLGTNDWLWSREVGTQKFLSQGMLGNRDTMKRTESGNVSERS